MKKLLTSTLFIVFLLTACGGTQPTTTNSASPTAAAGKTGISPATPSSSTPVNIPTDQANCTNSASFVEDVTVADYTTFQAGDAIHKVWRVKNTGSCTWNNQYRLVFVNGDKMGAPDSLPLQTVKPGETLDIAIDMVAPATDAVYRADFEIHTPSGASIPIDQNTILWTIVTVGNATAGSGDVGGSSGGAGLVNSTCAYTTDQSNVDAVIAAINGYRSQNNLPAYTVNPQLTLAAQSHSADMACNNLFVHIGSDNSTPQSRVAATGYIASSVTENVYGSWPPLTGQGVVSWWATDQTDPNHNKNLISISYKEIGVGYSFFNNYGYYVVVFAAP